MEPRPLTIFPKSTHAKPSLSRAQSKHPRQAEESPTRAQKRKFEGSNKPVDFKLLTALPSVKNTQYVQRINAKDENPESFYKCIYIVDPQGKRPHCFAQEKSLEGASEPYRIVLVRRSEIKEVFGLSKPNPNVLNIIDVFRFSSSMFTVFDRPGTPLSDIAMLPDLEISQIKTISREALKGICHLSDAGFRFSSFELSDITISAHDGRVKVTFDQAEMRGPEANVYAIAFGSLLVTLMELMPENKSSTRLSHPERWGKEVQAFIQDATCMTYKELQKVKFLQDSPPARSLIPFAMNAQVSVFPAEHAIGGQLIDLLKDTFGSK